MQILAEYSHLGGAEILQLHHHKIHHEINDVIGEINLSTSRLNSESNSKYSAKLLNEMFREGFFRRHFKERHVPFVLTLRKHGDRKPKAYGAASFTKSNIVVDVEPEGRPLIEEPKKWQYFFSSETPELVIEIFTWLDFHETALSSAGVSPYGLLAETLQARQRFPAVPVKVILVGMEGETPQCA